MKHVINSSHGRLCVKATHFTLVSYLYPALSHTSLERTLIRHQILQALQTVRSMKHKLIMFTWIALSLQDPQSYFQDISVLARSKCLQLKHYPIKKRAETCCTLAGLRDVPARANHRAASIPLTRPGWCSPRKLHPVFGNLAPMQSICSKHIAEHFVLPPPPDVELPNSIE